MAEHEIVCFQCGQSVGDPPRMNLVDGEPCHACAERLLETLPGIFHTPFETVEEAAENPETADAEVFEGTSEFDDGIQGADYEEA